MISRLDFIKAIGIWGGIIIGPLTKLKLWKYFDISSTLNQEEGEIYAGFLLLPDVNSQVPSFIQCTPAPLFGHIDNDNDIEMDSIKAETIRFANFDDFLRYNSVHTYKPDNISSNTIFLQGNIIRFTNSGEVFSIGMDYIVGDQTQTMISISSRPIFPRPCPIFPIYVELRNQEIGNNGDNNLLIVNPEKIYFTPTPGIMLPTQQGFYLEWIKQDILHTLVINHNQKRDAVIEITKSLAEI